MPRKGRDIAPRSKRGAGNKGFTHTGEITFNRDQIPSVTGGKSPAMDFTDALLHGNPEAERLVRNAIGDAPYVPVLGAHNEEEPSWADEFIASTYTICKGLGMTAHQAKRMEPTLAAYRADMKAAHRFVLDNDFTRLATEVSSTMSAEKLLTKVQFASLPYETTWIEFDLPTKVHTMRRIHGLKPWVDDLGRKMGLLLHRLSDTECVVQMIVEATGMDQLTPTMIAYFFSLREFNFEASRPRAKTGCNPFETSLPTPTLFEDRTQHEEAKAIGRASLWGYSNFEGGHIVQKHEDLMRLRLPSYLQRHGDIGFSRMFNGFIHAYEGEFGNKKFAELCVNEMGEFTGMMRWLVVVLAMLNEVPVYTSHIHPQGKIRVGLLSKRNYMDYHRVTLRLPKTDPLKYIEKHLRNAATRRHRAHEVRAHWRTYLPDTHCSVDQHDWTYDHDDGYRLCGRCMAFSRLIHEHVRGDESLGWVRKDYVIKRQQ